MHARLLLIRLDAGSSHVRERTVRLLDDAVSGSGNSTVLSFRHLCLRLRRS